MTWWQQAALWGLAGGSCVEALELYRTIHQTPKGTKWSWRQPIPQGLSAWVASVVIRAGVGAVLAAAAAASGQVAGPFGALGLGIAAPLVIEKLARLVAAQVGQNFELQPAQPMPASPAQAAHLPSIGHAPQPAPDGGAHAP